MSHFTCEKCDAPHWDTERGYISGCLCDGHGQWCDVCGREMELVNPDGWLRCKACCKEIKDEN